MRPYSSDLRSRILDYLQTHSIRETAKTFSVSPNTVFLLKKRWEHDGTLEPRRGAVGAPRAISPEGELYLQLILTEEPDLTLQALCDRYAETYGVRVCVSTMYNTLTHLGLTRKRKSFYDPHRDTLKSHDELEGYRTQVAKVPMEQRCYLDETGSTLNMTLPYGRSPRGERVYEAKPTAPGTRVNTLALLSETGLEAPFSFQGPLNTERFLIYLETFVVPRWTSGKTLILDQHPVHKAKAVQTYLNDKGIPFILLPPYSPELNPIEEAFSSLKQYIKKQKARTVEALMAALKTAYELIDEKYAKAFFNHAEELLYATN